MPGNVGRVRTRRALGILVGALLGVLLLRSPALAQQGSETTPPIQGQSAGDITVPPMGSPAVPKAPGTPATEGEALEGGATGAPGTGRLVEGLAGATGSDPTGVVAPTPWISLDPYLDVFLGASAGGGGGGGTSVYPLPVITTSRNEGTTVGGITPIVFTNHRGEVTRILAPTFTYNEIFGFQAGAHGMLYDGTTVIGGGAIVSNRVARDFYAEILDEAWLDGRAAIELFGRHQVDPSERFWGLGADTPQANETNYTLVQHAGRVNLGLNVTPRFQVFWRERLNIVHVKSGRVPNVPDTEDVFGPISGIPDATIVGHGVELRWDRRDTAFYPRNGFWLGVVAEANMGIFGNTQRFYPRFIADLRGFLTPGPDWFTIAARLRVEVVPGAKVPFYERAILGGPLTLRAYGTGRFTGSGSFLLQLEGRTRVFSRRVMGTWIDISIVPFIDVGRVFEKVGDISKDHWQVNPGIGLRMGVPPTIVVRLDVAFGDNGPGIFAGLGLPF